MYSGRPGQPGQDPNREQWDPQYSREGPSQNPSQYPPASQFPPIRDHPTSQYPPAQGYGDARGQRPNSMSDMVTLQPPRHPDIYRLPSPHGALPSPHEMFQGPPPPDPYRPPPQVTYSQPPAPRQRTAIACRYCRRRKIRCSGFESSEDGRCSNCTRFAQECIFTPVSSQTQAFVPAHTAYPHLRGNSALGGQNRNRALYTQQQPPPVIYGAHGQPLGTVPPQHGGDQYQSLPYSPYGYDDRQGDYARKRPAHEPHTPVLPPPLPLPNPGSSGRLPPTSGRRSSSEAYQYPDPHALQPVSPASSATSYQSAYSQAPYYTPTSAGTTRRASPPSAYSYTDRASASPHSSALPGAPQGYPFPGQYQGQPPTSIQQTPPQSSQPGTPGQPQGPGGPMGAQNSRMRITDMLENGEKNWDERGGSSDPGAGRSAADSNMLNALNRKPM